MLTGDNEHSAYAVANEVGIDKVHAKLLPEDQISKKLSSLRQEHGNVIFCRRWYKRRSYSRWC